VKNLDKHNRSFFGQSAGMFLKSTSKTEDFIFLQFIKKKENGTWEKPSNREGKTIKCSLEEIIMMLGVLSGKSKSWSTVHSYKEEKTPISVKWEGEVKVWFNVGGYPKMLTTSQIEILRLLLEHILTEKIEFATNSGKVSNTGAEVSAPTEVRKESQREKVIVNNDIQVVEELELGDGVKKIQGIIKSETERALLLQMENNNEFWFPKSTIKSQYTSGMSSKQSFIIDSWIIEKNKVLA